MCLDFFGFYLWFAQCYVYVHQNVLCCMARALGDGVIDKVGDKKEDKAASMSWKDLAEH